MNDPSPKPPATPAAPDMRRSARVIAVQSLYCWDLCRHLEGELPLPPDLADEQAAGSAALAAEMVEGVRGQRVALDGAIDSRLENWTVGRLAATDRAILRLGAYEILFRAETPPRVAINEAVELAKQFGSDGKTARLVNGVLDRLARDHRPTEVRKQKAAPATAPEPTA
jgi:transcription antitermination protein NusB